MVGETYAAKAKRAKCDEHITGRDRSASLSNFHQSEPPLGFSPQEAPWRWSHDYLGQETHGMLSQLPVLAR